MALFGLVATVPLEAQDQLEALLQAAEQGNAEAQAGLGAAYWTGAGIPADPAEAVRWFRMAARQDHAGVQYNLGVAYSNGVGVSRDKAEAVQWFRTAVRHDYAGGGAQYSLGRAYEHGEGVSRDYATAVRWYRVAAEQDFAEAQYALAALRARMAAGQGGSSCSSSSVSPTGSGRGPMGRTPSRKPAEAVRWWLQAAEQGPCAAGGEGVPVNIFGGSRREPTVAEPGEGVPVLNAEAVRRWLQAAVQG